MTANSQLISVKVVQGFFRKGFQSFLNLNRLNFSDSVLNGNSIKRLFDIVFASFILIVFSPLYLILMTLIALNSRGPIFYVQQRIGKNHQPFNCIAHHQ